MTNPLPLLFAAPNFQEIVGVLVTLAFFVIWVINQINDAKKKQIAQPPPQPRADMPPQPAAPAAATAGAAPPAEPLRAQVDEFLRRAGKQPAAARAQQPPRKPTGRDEVVVLLDDSVVAPQRTTLAEKMRVKGAAADAQRAKPTASQRPRETKSGRPGRVASPPRAQSVAQQVASHIGSASEEFRKEVADLGQRVKQADEQFDLQLQKKFDHELGSLSSRSTAATAATTTPATPSPAAQIAVMLSNPDGVRQAVILNEILQRPIERW